MSLQASLSQTDMPILIWSGKCYNVMVSADRYIQPRGSNPPHATQTPDTNFADSVTDLYMAALPEQAAAVVDFLNKNTDKLQYYNFDLTGLRSYQYNGGKYPEDYHHGTSGEYTALIRNGTYFGGHLDEMSIFVYATNSPHYQRKIEFTQVAIPRHQLDPGHARPAHRAPAAHRPPAAPRPALFPPVNLKPTPRKFVPKADLDAPHLLRHIDALLQSQQHV